MSASKPPAIPATLGLYVHIPWCVKKCPYCDFNSHAQTGPLPEKLYLEKLLEDLSFDAKENQQRPINSIFFGGGTPSLMSADFFAEFLDRASQIVNFAHPVEITLEANPGTVECAPFVALKHAGINRLSLGIQSLNDKHLRALGRIHSAQTARKALDQALTTGFNSVNADLMHGLPEQDLPDALDELHALIDTGVPHISWYQLTLEPNTVFYSKPPRLPSIDVTADIAQAGTLSLLKRGFEHYEISAFAKPGHSATHNRNYWQFGDYIGIGAGAHGKLTQPDGTIVRTQRSRSPKHYLAHATAELRLSQQSVPATDVLFEYCLNRFRLFEPFTLSQVQRLTGTSKDLLETLLNTAVSQGWLALSPAGKKAEKIFYITQQGQLFHNDLVSLFLPE